MAAPLEHRHPGGAVRASNALLPVPSNVSLLGVVGGAGGRVLYERGCRPQEPHACAEEALTACHASRPCDTAEVRSVRTPHCAGCMFTLRESYSSWTPPQALSKRLRPHVQQCGDLAQRARRVQLGGRLEPEGVRAWRQLFCEEYAGTPSRPPFRPDVVVAPPPGIAGRLHCPARTPTLHVFTYANRPTDWLCAFLRSAAFHEVPITVLGWNPAAFPRPDKVYYFIDRIYTWLRYLTACRGALHPRATLLLADNDQFIVAAHGELERKLEQLLRRASVAFSAENACAPRKLNNASWQHARLELPGVDFGHSPGDRRWVTGHPFCLNSGDIAGRPDAVIDLLNRTCRACQRGWSPQRVSEFYARSYSGELKGWIYSEQRVMMRLYLAAPNAQTGWTLDFRSEVFHANDGSWNAQVKEWPNGSFTNKITGRTPAIIHYNGGSRESWAFRHSPAARLARLQSAFVLRTGAASADAAEAAVDQFVRERVSFLGAEDFARRTDVAFRAAGGRTGTVTVCRAAGDVFNAKATPSAIW